jgi:hypothetical protein
LLLQVPLYSVTLLGPSLERDLGFRQGSAWLQSPGWRGYEEAVAIVSVTDGGVFQKAGFRAGDILPEESFIGLFRLLHRHRGRTAELVVVNGGDGEPFKARPRRTIRFFVPRPRRHALHTDCSNGGVNDQLI